jgi:hypothetical protein
MQTSFPGLTSDQAAARLAADGPNELPRAGRRRLLQILCDVLTAPMFVLLIGSGAIDPVCSMVFEARAAEDDIFNAPHARRPAHCFRRRLSPGAFCRGRLPSSRSLPSMCSPSSPACRRRMRGRSPSFPLCWSI